MLVSASPTDSAALLATVYDQLRKIAQQRMSDERSDHTLQATALVHEAWLRLVGHQPVTWANRAHFFDAAARAMRQILIDHARARKSQKRGAGGVKQPLSDFSAAFESNSDDVFALDDAISRLESEDPEAAAVVRLRFFAGMSGDEVAQALGISARKVDLVWARARAWLFRQLESDR
jgi:RNA polymerase sigma factor (TIGR02999 family)